MVIQHGGVFFLGLVFTIGLGGFGCLVDKERFYSLIFPLPGDPEGATAPPGLRQGYSRHQLLSDAQKRFGPQAEPGLIEWYAAEGGKTPAQVVLALQDCLLREDLTPLLPQIAAPTLILAATQDEITPQEVQHLMAQQMPNASLQTFEGVGHNMKVEIPDLLAGIVRDFVGKIESG